MPHDRPLSRRALLNSAAVVSLMAAGKKAWADPSEENLAALYRKLVPIPPAQWARIEAQVKADYAGVDIARYKTICDNLWTYLTIGAEPLKLEDEVAYDAYFYRAGNVTGRELANNIAEFDPFGQDRDTNVCAYLCGFEARKNAEGRGSTLVQTTHYQHGWDLVYLVMTAKLAKARKDGKSGEHGFGC